MRILTVEDDDQIGDALRRGLIAAGFAVDWVRDGRAATLAIEANIYALMLLDLGLPHRDGLEVLRELRRQGNDLPVIIITARSSVQERIAGLDLGADDYIGKPFDIDELIARMHALIRRHQGRTSPVTELGALRLDTRSRTVTLNGSAVDLSARELGLLEILMEHPGAVISRDRLEERLYGWGEEPASNTVEVHLHNLRRKLGGDRIRNIRGVGYKLVAP